MDKEHKLEIQALIKNLKELRFDTSIEKELLQKKLIRQLYNLVGEPKEEDFPDEYKIAGRCWKKHAGYTTQIGVMSKNTMEIQNNAPTRWHCTVQAYNVMCYKYVKHPHIENLWVCFYSSRDCNKYEYVLELGEDE